MAKGRTRVRRTPAKPIDPVKIYEQAMRFHVAIARLHQDMTREMNANQQQGMGLSHWIGIPILVMSALASELFLKCLICIETGRRSSGHHHARLFDHLSAATKAKLEAKWDGIVANREDMIKKIEKGSGMKIERKLRRALNQSGDTFVQLRYLYETENDIVSAMSDFHLSLKEMVLELKPEWKSI